MFICSMYISLSAGVYIWPSTSTLPITGVPGLVGVTAAKLSIYLCLIVFCLLEAFYLCSWLFLFFLFSRFCLVAGVFAAAFFALWGPFWFLKEVIEFSIFCSTYGTVDCQLEGLCFFPYSTPIIMWWLKWGYLVQSVHWWCCSFNGHHCVSEVIFLPCVWSWIHVLVVFAKYCGDYTSLLPVPC